MNGFDALVNAAGTWRGTSVLRDPHSGIDERCDSDLLITPVLNGTFVRIDYTWSYRGAPQHGTMLVGNEPASARATIVWGDTWHMGRVLMVSRGECRTDAVEVVGHYAAPPGPDWGWRTTLAPASDELRLTMFNIWPEGREDLAVDAAYRRVG